jgi:hypothetical protein
MSEYTPRRMTNKDLLGIIDKTRHRLEAFPEHPIGIVWEGEGNTPIDVGIDDYGDSGVFFNIYLGSVSEETEETDEDD